MSTTQTAPDETATRSSRMSHRLKADLVGWGFSAPYLLVFLVFMAGPWVI